MLHLPTAAKVQLRLEAGRWRRVPWLCLAWGCIALGAAGALLPLLPTTPFLLLAAWAAPKGSPRLASWLHQHPRFGPLLRAWRRERAVPARAKMLALLLMAGSWSALVLLNMPVGVLIFVGLLFVGIGAFLLTRPSPASRTDTVSPGIVIHDVTRKSVRREAVIKPNLSD